MEEKTFPKGLSSLRNFFGFINFYKFGFRRQNLYSYLKTSWPLKNGFTLVELIIVVAILALTATATLLSLNPFGQFNKARDARMKSDLSQIQKALETYYQDNGKYPDNATSCSYSISGSNGDSNDCIEWGKSWQPYMNIVPADSVAGHKYIYSVGSNGQSYYLYANLNNSRDLQACNGGGACASLAGNGISSTACGGTCNYGVASPNVNP